MSQITIAPVFSWLVIILISCLVLLFTLMQYNFIRNKLGRRRAGIVSLLRFAAISLIVIFAMNPSLIATRGQRVAPSIAVIIDTSPSMGQPLSQEKVTRLEATKALLTEGADPLLNSLSEKYQVSLYGLAEALRPLDTKELASLKAGGKRGNINEALKTLTPKHAAVLLLSDGNAQWQENQGPLVPTLTVPLGNQEAYRDIVITGIKAPALAFQNREIVIEVTISSYGYKGASVPVFLREGEKLLTSREIPIPSERAQVTASLTFVPDGVGRRNLSVSIPPQAGESLTANNQTPVPLNVVRDKVRILMVSGTPSMNYRFLRTALKSDPSIDLLSFVILRTPADILNVPTQEQSLIPFPVETLFTKELSNFDLVIFDNFDYAMFLRPDYLENLRKYVREGHSFAMIGGPRIGNEDTKGLSPISDMLPVRFAEKEFYRRDAPIHVRLSRAGARHPLMHDTQAFREGEGDDLRFWREMPPLDGINVTDAKRSSIVLLESAEGIPRPILAISEFGKGRTMILATDFAWKWYMGMAARGKETQSYFMLVHRLVRWLTKDPAFDPLRLIPPETTPAAGKETDITVQLHIGDASRESKANLSVAVFNPEGAEIASRLKPARKPGEYLASFLPEKTGTYRIKVETPLGRLEESLDVAGPAERLDAAPDHDLLQKIAAATGGKYIAPGHSILRAIEGYAQKAERQFIERRERPIWSTWLMMVIILAFLSLEWYLRRRWGLV